MLLSSASTLVSDQCVAIWVRAAMLAVSEELVALLAKAERNPAERPEAEEEKDGAD